MAPSARAKPASRSPPRRALRIQAPFPPRAVGLILRRAPAPDHMTRQPNPPGPEPDRGTPPGENQAALPTATEGTATTSPGETPLAPPEGGSPTRSRPTSGGKPQARAKKARRAARKASKTPQKGRGKKASPKRPARAHGTKTGGGRKRASPGSAKRKAKKAAGKGRVTKKGAGKTGKGKRNRR